MGSRLGACPPGPLFRGPAFGRARVFESACFKNRLPTIGLAVCVDRLGFGFQGALSKNRQLIREQLEAASGSAVAPVSGKLMPRLPCLPEPPSDDSSDTDSNVDTPGHAAPVQPPPPPPQAPIANAVDTWVTGREKAHWQQIATVLPSAPGIPSSSAWISIRRNFQVRGTTRERHRRRFWRGRLCHCRVCVSAADSMGVTTPVDAAWLLAACQTKDQPELTYIPYFGDDADARVLADVYNMKYVARRSIRDPATDGGA